MDKGSTRLPPTRGEGEGQPPKPKKPKPARGTGWGILNPYGDLWTYEAFHTEAQARAHVAHFWRNTKDIDLSRFTPVRVRVTVSALPAEPASAAATKNPIPGER